MPALNPAPLFTMKMLILFFALALQTDGVQADETNDLFFGSYSVVLPQGVILSDPHIVPADEYRQQLSIIDDLGQESFGEPSASRMRMTLLRGISANAPESVPEKIQYFILDSTGGLATDAQRLLHRTTNSFFWLNRSDPMRAEIKPLEYRRIGETWWGYDAELGMSVLFDSSVPSTELCRVLGGEIICVYRVMAQDVDWIAKFALPLDRTEFPRFSQTDFVQSDYLKIPLEILQSIKVSPAYKPCCLPISN